VCVCVCVLCRRAPSGPRRALLYCYCCFISLFQIDVGEGIEEEEGEIDQVTQRAALPVLSIVNAIVASLLLPHGVHSTRCVPCTSSSCALLVIDAVCALMDPYCAQLELSIVMYTGQHRADRQTRGQTIRSSTGQRARAFRDSSHLLLYCVALLYTTT